MAVVATTEIRIRVTLLGAEEGLPADYVTSLLKVIAWASAEADEEALNSLPSDIRQEVVRALSRRPPPTREKLPVRRARTELQNWVSEESVLIVDWGRGSKWLQAVARSSLCLAVATMATTGYVLRSAYEATELRLTVDEVISTQMDLRTAGLRRWLRGWIAERDLEEAEIVIDDGDVSVTARIPENRDPRPR